MRTVAFLTEVAVAGLGAGRATSAAVAVGWAAGAAISVAGCAPALDWREVRPAGTAVTAMLPCKPGNSVREVRLGGQPVRMAMLSCKAGDLTWALATADLADPARVGPGLQALRESTSANLQGREVTSSAAAVRGATPNAASARVHVSGRRPDGAAAEALFVVFAHGTQVFQAIVVGAKVEEPVAETMFAALRAGR